jgi:hypothetical protein
LSAKIFLKSYHRPQSEKNLLLHPALEIEEDDVVDCMADLKMADLKSNKSEREFCFL